MKANHIAKGAVKSMSAFDIIYEFRPDEFNEFCEQLCKEQRQLMRVAYSANRFNSHNVIKKALLNTPTPDYK